LACLLEQACDSLKASHAPFAFAPAPVAGLLILLTALATPGLLPSLEKELGPYADGIAEDLPGDVNRTRFAVKLLETREPYFMTAYLTALDNEQHASGPDTPASRKTLEGIDALIGELVAAAQQTHPDGVVAIVSDHGFAPVQQDVNLYRPFIEAGLIIVQGGKVSGLEGDAVERRR